MEGRRRLTSPIGRVNSCPTTREQKIVGGNGANGANDKLNGTKKYKENVNLPIVIKRELEPICFDLCKDELLKKCLHGLTQS